MTSGSSCSDTFAVQTAVTTAHNTQLCSGVLGTYKLVDGITCEMYIGLVKWAALDYESPPRDAHV